MNELKDHGSREHALLSASSAHRWLICPPSAVAAELYPDTDTEYTREGTLAHEVAEAVAAGRVKAANIETNENTGVDAEMVDCASSYADYIEEQKRSNTAVVMLEERVDFSEWVPRGFGTADCIIIQGNTMDVIDYKYGKGVAVSASDNPQMKLYGLGALSEYGFIYDVEHIRLHIFQPRLNSVSVFDTTAEDLRAWGGEVVKPTAEKAIQGKGKYKAGEHCRFCPHAGRCRALTKSCTEYVNTHGMSAKIPVLTEWEVADVLRMEPTISLWLKRVKDQALSTILAGGEIPGYKVVEGRGSRTWADELEVAAWLSKQGYSQEEYTKTEVLSVAQMEKALGKKKVADLLNGHILKKTGAPTVVPASDKRPAYDPAADFNNLEE